MSMNRARLALLLIFVASLLLQAGAFFVVRPEMWPNEFQALLLRLLAIYSIQLSVVLAGIFAQPSAVLAPPPAGLTWAALLATSAWNLLLILRSTSFVLSEDSVTDLMKDLETIASASSFLVAGAIAFFFGKGTEVAAPTPTARRDEGIAAKDE